MGTRTYDKIVTDTSLEEFLMEFPVDFQKEIFRSAVDDQGEISILDAVQLGHDRVGIPAALVFCFLTQVVAHSPAFWERTDVYTAAGTSGCSEQILVTEGQPHTSVSAHAESGDGPSLAVFDGGIAGVAPGGQLPGYKGIKLAFRT